MHRPATVNKGINLLKLVVSGYTGRNVVAVTGSGEMADNEFTSGLTASGLSQAALDTIVEEVSQRLRYSQGGRSGSIGRHE